MSFRSKLLTVLRAYADTGASWATHPETLEAITEGRHVSWCGEFVSYVCYYHLGIASASVVNRNVTGGWRPGENISTVVSGARAITGATIEPLGATFPRGARPGDIIVYGDHPTRPANQRGGHIGFLYSTSDTGGYETVDGNGFMGRLTLTSRTWMGEGMIVPALIVDIEKLVGAYADPRGPTSVCVTGSDERTLSNANARQKGGAAQGRAVLHGVRVRQGMLEGVTVRSRTVVFPGRVQRPVAIGVDVRSDRPGNG